MVSPAKYVPGREIAFYDFGRTCASGNRIIPREIALSSRKFMSGLLQPGTEWPRLQEGILAGSETALKGFLTALTLSFSDVRGPVYPKKPLLGETDACRLAAKIMDKAVLHTPSYYDHEEEEFNPEFLLGISGLRGSALLPIFRCAHEVAHNALKLSFNMDAGNRILAALHEYDADVKAHALIESMGCGALAHEDIAQHYTYSYHYSNAENPGMDRIPNRYDEGRGAVFPLMRSKKVSWADAAVLLSGIEKAMAENRRLPSMSGISFFHLSLCNGRIEFDTDRIAEWVKGGLFVTRFHLVQDPIEEDWDPYNFISVY
ncbi:MAG: hypothetical protein WC490_00805 [Candidatus Margulisiibacteriota bacterium]